MKRKEKLLARCHLIDLLLLFQSFWQGCHHITRSCRIWSKCLCRHRQLIACKVQKLQWWVEKDVLTRKIYWEKFQKVRSQVIQVMKEHLTVMNNYQKVSTQSNGTYVHVSTSGDGSDSQRRCSTSPSNIRSSAVLLALYVQTYNTTTPYIPSLYTVTISKYCSKWLECNKELGLGVHMTINHADSTT